jgi:hypothetical protein
MIEKTSPAGWVVQVTIPAPVSELVSPGSRLAAISGRAPSFKYFNVAIAAPGKAIEAIRENWAEAMDREASTVRGLSAEEISSLGLTLGQVRPA